MPEKVLIKAGKDPKGQDQELHALHGVPGEAAIGHLEKTLLLMTHGFPGHKNGQENVFATLEELAGDRGFHTLRFDFRGCGASDGAEEDFTLAGAGEDFQHVLFWAKQKGYEHFIMAGEGLGATIALMHTNMSVSGNILLWPVLDTKAYAHGLSGGDSIAVKPDKDGYIDVDGFRISNQFLNELKKTDLLYAIKEAFAPTLVMHGADDKMAPASSLDILRDNTPSKRVEITVFHEGDHGLNDPRHRKMVFYHILQFLEKYA
jgi:pimeloyl-ACP methyl ester carboxylesterase